MGRELCISLTSVVLEAINTVQQAQRRSQVLSSPAKSCPSPQQQQRRNSSDSANPEDETLRERPAQQQQAGQGERKRPSSERLTRGSGSPLALAAAGASGGGGGTGMRERAGSVQLPATRRVVKAESVAGTAGVAKRFYKEDPGLKDLDRREEEFRQVFISTYMRTYGKLLDKKMKRTNSSGISFVCAPLKTPVK